MICFTKTVAWNLSMMTLLFLASRVNFGHAADRREWSGEKMSAHDIFIFVLNSSIENELSIMPEQRQALAEVEGRFRMQYREVMRINRNATNEEQKLISERRAVEIAALDREYRPQIFNILTAAQRERLYQVVWQLNAALAISEEPNVISRISLTDEQKVAMSEIIATYEKALKEARHDAPLRVVLCDRQEAAEEKRDDQALKILTAIQRSEWSNLTGKPIDVGDLRPQVNPLRMPLNRAKARAAANRERATNSP